MRRLITYPLLFILAIFITPAVLHMGMWWLSSNQPGSWRQANWSSAGILPAPKVDDAAIYLLSARTGGMKGALASHSWLVVKVRGRAIYERYEVVGWGNPVRRNAYDADGHWYSNRPRVIWSAKGEDAANLVGPIEKAIAAYPNSRRGDYTIWPGPNSNTFIAHIVRSIPGLTTDLPAEAVGRDFPKDGGWLWRDAAGTLRGTLGGYAGFAVGGTAGFELNFLGLVSGFNWEQSEVKVPGFGTLRLG
jgi:hypothetical protein